jgi:hypothetical protein
MKPYDTFRAFYDGGSASHVWQHHPGPGQDAGAGSHNTFSESAITRPPRHTSQAERAAMHPDHHDLEWHYWRGGWGRLTG